MVISADEYEEANEQSSISTISTYNNVKIANLSTFKACLVCGAKVTGDGGYSGECAKCSY